MKRFGELTSISNAAGESAPDGPTCPFSTSYCTKGAAWDATKPCGPWSGTAALAVIG